MTCRGCGKKLAGMRCCLCGRNVLAPATPWGKTRKICMYCKDRELKLVEMRLEQNKRTEALMKGEDFIKRNLNKPKGLVK